MIIDRLQVTQLRVFDSAEFVFAPGMNLVVGVNGVGKTTVLDALRILLSKTLPEITASKSRPDSFRIEDIRCRREGLKAQALTAQIDLRLSGANYSFTVHKQPAPYAPDGGGMPRQQALETPDRDEWLPAKPPVAGQLRCAEQQPIAVFFSTRRSLVRDAAPSKGSAAGGQAAAYADALTSRELRLAETAHWMKVQEELAEEDPAAVQRHRALTRAASRFLPECKNLRAKTDPKPRLLLEKKRVTLDVRQLSDGERGLLAIVLDLARRLSQANPGLPDPVRNGKGVVLIDELDLHLHPKWQRTIVGQLVRTFPKCQFIATTHSPQIVAAVEPEQVLLLTDKGVIRPDRTLGMDSNWILRHIMEADDRPRQSAKAISRVEALIRKGEFEKARAEIAAQREAGRDLPEWSVLEARMARMEVLAE
jgi:predicted ATP-binding protein involved in virulence